jgi:hypothetical protein
MVLGKMKDEAHGNVITEFVGLRAKMYSYTTASGHGLPDKESLRAKGIQRAAALTLHHTDYLHQLNDPVENAIRVRRIGHRHHMIQSMQGDKRCLCAFDDKRYILEDRIKTLAHGHKDIIHEEMLPPIDDDEETAPSEAEVDVDEGLPFETVPLRPSTVSADELFPIDTEEALQALAATDLRREIADATRSRLHVAQEPTSKRQRIDSESNSSNNALDDIITATARIIPFDV